MASVLARLGFSFQVSIHVTVALTPDCMEAVRLSAELSEHIRAVSSAKRLTFGTRAGKSLTYSRNRSGPSMDPWGTLDTTSNGSDREVDTLTVWWRQER